MAEATDPGASLGAYLDVDLLRWAAEGSSADGFAEAMFSATRARFLLLAIGASHGGDVGKGLARGDAEAALRLASTPAPDHDGLLAKRLALREHVLPASPGLLGAMVRAALEHDARRLGAGRRRAPFAGHAGRVVERRRSLDGPGAGRDAVVATSRVSRALAP